ncbi:MAG: hypothetical protein E7H54_04455 [Clostridium perfringens]|nr:hypothetical protein [Clostridium perfringens]
MLENWEDKFSEMLQEIYTKEGKNSDKLSLLNRSYCLNRDIVGERVTEVLSKESANLYDCAVALYNNLKVFQIPVYNKVDVGSYGVKKYHMSIAEE